MKDWLEKGVDLFNSGRYYEAHECWEDLWRETQGPARRFYQGLVQIAVGMHHLSRGNRGGGRRVLARGREKLRDYPLDYAGMDNRRLTEDLDQVLEGRGPRPIRIRSMAEG